MSIVFSGIQPTGNLHLGNYLGAIKNWTEMLNDSRSTQFIFSIVDLHSITIFQDPQELKDNSLKTLATYIACGLTPEKYQNITLFQQSFVKEHSELCWILSCITPAGWLDRMTQYKDKTQANKERANLGLYSYPVLMASDILLYDSTLVPIGEDQVQHLELTRNIAERFNRLHNKSIFKIPEYKLGKIARVMSLKDGAKKMSKSDPSEQSRINLIDSNDEIKHKISKSKTGESSSPEMTNLLNIYNDLASSQNAKPISATETEGNCASFKAQLTDLLITTIEPIRESYHKLLTDKEYLQTIISKGNSRASEIAGKKLKQIREVIGIL